MKSKASNVTTIKSLGMMLLGIVYLLAGAAATFFDALDDSILHKINWMGKTPDEPLDHLESVLMSTARNELYKCTLPQRQISAGDENGAYTGPNPLELLSPLFKDFVCTFKLETYWTYELCHGKFIRQYHEEREGKKVKLQEYFLGKWSKDDLEKRMEQVREEIKDPDYKSSIPTKKIDGVNMPYLQINMSDGTLCDINGQPRNTRVLYVCYPHGKHEIYSLEEVSTCEYEIVVLSPYLCQHPNYRSKETGENEINCYAVEDAPKQPKALTELEAESLKVRQEQLLVKLQNLESLLENKIKGDVKPIELGSLIEDEDILRQPVLKPALYDPSFVSGFLKGKNCLTGGSHWWKFEFCYGKHVLQFHEEPGSPSRTEIMLGKWNQAKHKEWLDQNPSKKSLTAESKKTLYHFYSGGDLCDQTAAPRTVEVRFRCVESQSSSAVAVYLTEPKTCEYMLGVESNMFCSILKNSDDYGLIDIENTLLSTSGSKSPDRSPPKPSKTKKLRSFKDIEILVADDEEDNA